jgi:predicted XRE-type DNA-binding protein
MVGWLYHGGNFIKRLFSGGATPLKLARLGGGVSVGVYEIIGIKLKELRELKCLGQIDVAKILKIKQPYYSQLENARKKISIDQLLKIAEEYDIELDWFLGRD